MTVFVCYLFHGHPCLWIPIWKPTICSHCSHHLRRVYEFFGRVNCFSLPLNEDNPFDSFLMFKPLSLIPAIQLSLLLCNTPKLLNNLSAHFSIIVLCLCLPVLCLFLRQNQPGFPLLPLFSLQRIKNILSLITEFSPNNSSINLCKSKAAALMSFIFLEIHRILVMLLCWLVMVQQIFVNVLDSNVLLRPP